MSILHQGHKALVKQKKKIKITLNNRKLNDTK